jgi:hypothetical protein
MPRQIRGTRTYDMQMTLSQGLHSIIMQINTPGAKRTAMIIATDLATHNAHRTLRNKRRLATRGNSIHQKSEASSANKVTPSLLASSRLHKREKG